LGEVGCFTLVRFSPSITRTKLLHNLAFELREKGLPHHGKKADLLQRLTTFIATSSSSPPDQGTALLNPSPQQMLWAMTRRISMNRTMIPLWKILKRRCSKTFSAFGCRPGAAEARVSKRVSLLFLRYRADIKDAKRKDRCVSSILQFIHQELVFSI